MGGAEPPLALAELGLIDEYEFVVHPLLAGHGPTLFVGLSKPIDLRLVSQAVRFGCRGQCGTSRERVGICYGVPRRVDVSGGRSSRVTTDPLHSRTLLTPESRADGNCFCNHRLHLFRRGAGRGYRCPAWLNPRIMSQGNTPAVEIGDVFRRNEAFPRMLMAVCSTVKTD